MLPPLSAGRYPGSQYEANMNDSGSAYLISDEHLEVLLAEARRWAAKGDAWALKTVIEFDCAKAMFAYAAKVR